MNEINVVLSLIAQIIIAIIAIIGAFIVLLLTFLRKEVDDYRMRIINHIVESKQDKGITISREKFYHLDDGEFNEEIRSYISDITGHHSELTKSLFEDDFSLFKVRFNSKQNIIKYFIIALIVSSILLIGCFILIRNNSLLEKSVSVENIFYLIIVITFLILMYYLIYFMKKN